MRHAQPSSHRGGFTLVELIVVILIILLLMGLVGAGVLKYMALAPQLQTTNEIRQLEVGCEAFKTKYKLYPPSMIFLCNDVTQYTNKNNPLAQQGYQNTTLGAYSLGYLNAIWQRNSWTPPGQPNAIDWSGGKGMPAGGIILEGDQCLVYFLSGPFVGVQGGNVVAGTGWSTDPTNPTNLSVPLVPPFFDFKSDGLVSIAHPGTSQAANVFVSYQDPYKTPTKFNVYAFFSSGRNQVYNTDCPSLGVSYYVQNNGRAYNPNTLQIISAGADFVFGPGALWPGGPNAKYYTPANNVVPLSNANANRLQNAQGSMGNGFDDLSNFSGGLLGVP